MKDNSSRTSPRRLTIDSAIDTLTNHLAGKPFADVDLSLEVHDNSKKGTA